MNDIHLLEIKFRYVKRKYEQYKYILGYGDLEMRNIDQEIKDLISEEINNRERRMAWLLCAKRMGVCKDVRRLIYKLMQDDQKRRMIEIDQLGKKIRMFMNDIWKYEGIIGFFDRYYD